MYVFSTTNGDQTVITEDLKLTADVAINDARLGSSAAVNGPTVATGAPHEQEEDVRTGRGHIFGEDKTRSKNRNLNANLAILRMALLAIKAYRLQSFSWPQFVENAQANTAFAF